MSKLSELISQQAAPEVELPKRFPSITDWVIYWFGDPSSQSPALPMQMKVTSGMPTTGQLSGIAFFDPGTILHDANGQPVELPPLLPIRQAAYSRHGLKGSWMHIPEFQRLIKRQVKEMQQEAESPGE